MPIREPSQAMFGKFLAGHPPHLVGGKNCG
jgi:hypothetical protein